MRGLLILCTLMTSPFDMRQERVNFGQLAEGRTSRTLDDRIVVAYRLFSAPDFSAECDNARAADVVRLQAREARLRLRVGEAFALSRLKIVALDASGSILPRVPVAIESEIDSRIVNLRADRIADAMLTPIAPGSVRLRVRTICEGRGVDSVGRGAETIVSAIVVR